MLLLVHAAMSPTISGLAGISWHAYVLGSAINPERNRGEKIQILVSHSVYSGELKKKLEKILLPGPPRLLSLVKLRVYSIFPLENLKECIKKTFTRSFTFVL